ncbi:hypothetical protein IC582_022851 [Cucumis melo]
MHTIIILPIMILLRNAYYHNTNTSINQILLPNASLEFTIFLDLITVLFISNVFKSL